MLGPNGPREKLIKYEARKKLTEINFKVGTTTMNPIEKRLRPPQLAETEF